MHCSVTRAYKARNCLQDVLSHFIGCARSIAYQVVCLHEGSIIIAYEHSLLIRLHSAIVTATVLLRSTELLRTLGASAVMLCMVRGVIQPTLSATMYAMELCTLLLMLLSTLHGGTFNCLRYGSFGLRRSYVLGVCSRCVCFVQRSSSRLLHAGVASHPSGQLAV
jgi:hypothetical protein